MVLAAGPAPRAVCPRCRRPVRVCYCRHITPLETTTRVVLLQHPRERDVAIGTAYMASLCLPRAELHVGVDWSDSPALARALADPGRRAVLLYPGAGAVDLAPTPPAEPLTLVVVDGTWAQTRKVVRLNPALRALPRVTFTPATPSEYRIRKEPDAACVSTIEALMHVLGRLEGEPARFRALLDPFRAMIDAQLACERLGGAPRVRRRPRRERAPAPPAVPPWLRARAADLLCVAGEANAWPYGSAERAGGCADELVQWVAHRPASGETFALLVAPRQALAPGATANSGLPRPALLAGADLPTLQERWRAFVRPTDVMCGWGWYGAGLFVAAGGELPATRVDLRAIARARAGARVGTVEELVARGGAAAAPPLAPGRAGWRLAQLAAFVRGLVAAD
ncbi:MAG TPA: tRNA-uridine aminocarboxypropyltransferase [Polyangia bacterium]